MLKGSRLLATKFVASDGHEHDVVPPVTIHCLSYRGSNLSSSRMHSEAKGVRGRVEFRVPPDNVLSPVLSHGDRPRCARMRFALSVIASNGGVKPLAYTSAKWLTIVFLFCGRSVDFRPGAGFARRMPGAPSGRCPGGLRQLRRAG